MPECTWATRGAVSGLGGRRRARCYPDLVSDDAERAESALWRYFHDVRAAVARGNRGTARQPYRRGTFLVDARAGDVELVVSDVTEEDAVLIAAELAELGVRAVVRASVRCPTCGARVPAQDYCAACRARLADEQDGG